MHSLPGEQRKVGGWVGVGVGCWQQDGVILYSGDELTLLCKCQKVISSLTSFPPSNIFDEEIKSNTYGAQEHSEALNAYC